MNFRISGRHGKKIAISIATLGVALLISVPMASANNYRRANRDILQFSLRADRHQSANLNGATLSGEIAIFARVSRASTSVEFFLDDETLQSAPYSTERIFPYDFGTTGKDLLAKLVSFDAIAEGPHRITARIRREGRKPYLTSASFTVTHNVISDPNAPESVPSAQPVPEAQPEVSTTTTPIITPNAPEVMTPTPASAPATNTTLPAGPIFSGGNSEGCRFDSATQPVNVAFCETFDSPQGNGGKTGDLNPTLWGVSRVGDINPGQQANNIITDTKVVGCGPTATNGAPNDVRICNGQLYEAQNDNHGVVNLNMYPKQPFNFAGRTGTVAFDVSGDSAGTHAAWPEFVITDKPVPGQRGSISLQVPAGAANSIGFALDGGCNSGDETQTGVGLVFMTKNNAYSEPSFSTPNCITKGSASRMNHIEVRVNQNRMEVWGTDGGASTLKLLAVTDNLGLGFTQGLVWMNDVHYNARKSIEPCECGPQFEHTFVWDNLGFDGPKTYRDLGFDVADANIHSVRNDFTGVPTGGTAIGYAIGSSPLALNVSGVYRNQTPTAALVVFNSYSFATELPSISINGGPWIDTPFAFPDGTTYSWRAVAIPVPLDQVHDGTNTITFRANDLSATIANISLILVAGAPVP